MSRPALAVLTAAATATLALTAASAAEAHDCTCKAKSHAKHAVRHVRHAPTYARYDERLNEDPGYDREIVRERVIYAPPPPPLVQRVYVPAPPPRILVRRVYAGPVFRPGFRPLYGPPPLLHRGWGPGPAYAYGGPRWSGPHFGGPDWRHRW